MSTRKTTKPEPVTVEVRPADTVVDLHEWAAKLLDAVLEVEEIHLDPVPQHEAA